MIWKRKDKYAEVSDCGRYSCCAIGFDNGQRGFFEAWRSRAHPDGVHLVATNLPSADDARRLCEEDSRDEP